MSKYAFSRYKIKLDATSKKVQGLRVGDVVRRQYFDYPNLIYSLMVVLEIGFDNVVVNGVTKQSHYFIGALMDGDEPESGQLLDFVRVTNLFDSNRSGALYLTASDDQAPYLDVVDGMATENTLCYPFMIGGVGDIANTNKYACVGESYVTQEYFKSSEDSYRVFKLTKNNTPLGSSNNILIKQSISQALKNPQRVLISFKHRGSKEAQGIPMSFGYTSGEQMDGIDSFDCATTWKYHFSAITIDYPEQYQRSFEVDLTNYLTSENDWFEMSDLNIVLLSDIGNFGKSTKTRIGKLNGILDPVFGNIDGYGAFFQKMYATKNVNIAGTLTAGDENGFASTFYVGKIHKNCLINSLYGNFSGIVNIVGNEQSPSGIGKVFELTSGSATIIAQSEEWTNNNKDKKYCFSFWAKANNVGTFNVKTNINENTDFTIDIPNSWKRYCVPFTIKNISGHGCEIKISSQDSTFMFSSAQLESGDRSTLYQPTDSLLSDVDDYGAWFNRGGIGGTIQNPLLKLDQDGSIRSNNGSFVINNDGTGYFSNGAIKWFGDRVELAENVKLKWINLDPETQVNLKGEPGVDANLLDWISEWDNGKTMLNDSLIVTPKIFSGNVLNGLLNGVAIGNFPVTYINKSGVSETYSVNGIAGFKSGKRIFKIDDSGGEIGGWVLDNDSIYLGAKVNTPQSFSSIIGDITIGTLGIRGKAWYFDASGAVQIGLGPNSIKYDPTVGNIVFGDSVTMKWDQINVADGEINGTYIANNSITTNHIQADAIEAINIKAGIITGDKIATGTIDATNIKAGTITGDRIVTGTITGDLIKANAITSSHIQVGTINGDRITANTITSLGKVTAAEIELKSADGLITNFYVSPYGVLQAKGATIEGNLTALNGNIGGWSISNTGISAGNISILSSGKISNEINGTTYWSLNNDGSIVAEKISVIGGDIAGWNIDSDAIYFGQKSNTHRSFSNSGDMTIGTNGIRGSRWIFDSDGYFSIGDDPNIGDSYMMFDPILGEFILGDRVSIRKANGDNVNIIDNIDAIKDAQSNFLRKDQPDSTDYLTGFNAGITIGESKKQLLDIIRLSDLDISPSDTNVYTSLSVDTIITALEDKYIRKDKEDSTLYPVDFRNGLLINSKRIGDIIRYYDEDKPVATDANIYSALQTDQRIEDELKPLEDKYIRKDQPDSTLYPVDFTAGLSINSKRIGDVIRYYDENKPVATDANIYSALQTDQRIDEEFGKIDDRYIRKDKEDIAHKHITFEDGITVYQLAEMMNVDVKNLATIAKAVVSILRSSKFVDGFSGEGYQIWQDIATGDWNMTLDRLTVRKVLTIYELVLQKIRSVGGMVVVSAANGKVKSVERIGNNYLFTFDDTNQFQPDDFMRCQVFSPSGLKYYWVKVASVSGESVIVPLSEFDGVIPAAGDEVVLMGNATDKLRQSLILISATGDGQPRFDCLDGVKSKSFEGCLKVRVGSLDGISDSRFPADMQPSGYGLYGNNCFLTGIFVLSNGKDVMTMFSIMEGMIKSEISSVRNEINAKDNYLSNASFSGDLMDWSSTNRVRVFRVDNRLLSFNNNFYANKENLANITLEDGRSVLRLKNSSITQYNSNFARHPEFEEKIKYEEVEVPVLDADGNSVLDGSGQPITELQEVPVLDGEGNTVMIKIPRQFYISFNYMVKRTGTLTVYFKNESSDESGNSYKEEFEPYDPIYFVQSLLPTSGFQKMEIAGKWNGKGHFYLAFTGDMYLYSLALADNPLAEMEEKFTMRFEATDKKIQANLDEIKKTGTRLEEYHSEFLLTARNLQTKFTEDLSDAESRITVAYKSYVNLTARDLTVQFQADINNAETRITEAYTSAIELSAKGLQTKFTADLTDMEAGITAAYKSYVNLTAQNLEAGFTEDLTDLRTGVTEAYKAAIDLSARGLRADFNSSIADLNGKLTTHTSSFHVTASKIEAMVTATDNISNTIRTAGWITTADGNKLWATISTVDELGNKLTTHTGSFHVTASKIEAMVSATDSISNTIRTAGWITTADGNKLWATISTVDELGNKLTTHTGSFHVTASKIEAMVSATDSISNTIRTAGWITTADGNKLWATISTVDALGNRLTSHEGKFHVSATEISGIVTRIDATESSISGINKTISSSGWITTADGNKLWSTLTQYNALNQVVSTHTGSFHVTATKINSMVESIDDTGRKYSAITQTVGEIRADVNDVSGKYANLSLKVDAISAVVGDGSTGSFSEFLQTVNEISASVTEVKNGLDTHKGSFHVTADKIEAMVTATDNISNTINTAGWLTTAEANSSWVKKGNVISSINQTAESVTIDASKINLYGAVTLSAMSSDLRATIEGKADASILGELARKDAVSKAMLDDTLIQGGYLKNTLIDVEVLYVKNVKASDASGKVTTTIDGATGMLSAKGAVFEQVKVTGSLRNPFSTVSSITDTDYNDNVVVISSGSNGWNNVYSLPWDIGQSGRTIRLVNYKWKTTVSTGFGTIYAPSGKSFFEDGIQKSSIKMSREVLELLGYGDDSNFYGWIVLNRINIATENRYGRELRFLVEGVVDGISNSSRPQIYYQSFDNSALSVTRRKEGEYRINIPSAWGFTDNNYLVMLTGYGSVAGRSDTPVKATVSERQPGYFVVQTSDDASMNDGSFAFWVTSGTDWSSII